MSESLIPSKPVPECGQVFTKRVQGLLDGQPKDDETVAQALKGMDEMFDLIAAGLYSLASMLVGEGEDSIRLVETAVANAEVSECWDAVVARQSSRRALAVAALKTLAAREPAAWRHRRGKPGRRGALRTTNWRRRGFLPRSSNG